MLVVCLILVAVLAVGCGGENLTVEPATDADTAEPPREERNYIPEASTPGSGGFIETPQTLSTEGVPGRFEGAERRVYAQAEHVCGQLPKRVVRSMNAIDFADLHSKVFPKAWRHAAREGCRAGLRS